MTKLRLLCLLVLLALLLPGCQSHRSALPTLTPDEMETVLPDISLQQFSGKILDILLPDTLVVELESPLAVEAWGEIVYVITNQADKWCKDDMISVSFTVAVRPHDPAQYVRILADKISAYVLWAKPIIYLYPETATECSVKLTLKGQLTCTYPNYGNGWDRFTAHPDGTLVFPDGKEYYALYWEGLQESRWDFSTGFCVKREDTVAFLEWALSKQGLTRREANEFIVYWLPILQDHPYNIISFQTKAYTDGAVLDVSPAPDTLLRVFMAFYGSPTEVDIPSQDFTQPQRRGFTVVEWGGSQVTAPR